MDGWVADWPGVCGWMNDCWPLPKAPLLLAFPKGHGEGHQASACCAPGLVTAPVNLAWPRPGIRMADACKVGHPLAQPPDTLAQPNLKANDIIVWRHNVCGHLLTWALVEA